MNIYVIFFILIVIVVMFFVKYYCIGDNYVETIVSDKEVNIINMKITMTNKFIDDFVYKYEVPRDVVLYILNLRNEYNLNFKDIAFIRYNDPFFNNCNIHMDFDDVEISMVFYFDDVVKKLNF